MFLPFCLFVWLSLWPPLALSRAHKVRARPSTSRTCAHSAPYIMQKTCFWFHLLIYLEELRLETNFPRRDVYLEKVMPRPLQATFTAMVLVKTADYEPKPSPEIVQCHVYLRNVDRKKRDYVGKIPKGGGGV